MPSCWRAALPLPITIIPGEDRDVGSPRQSPSAPTFSPITPTWSPITPVFSPVTANIKEQQRDESIAMPALESNYYNVPRDLRWLKAEDEADKFCTSPNGNARTLNGKQYLAEVLEEAEVEKSFSEDWYAASGAWYEKVHGTERGGGLVELPDPLPAQTVVAPPMGPPRAARKARKRANRGGGVATRKQPKRACKKKRNYRE